MNKYFDIRRFGQLLRLDLSRFQRSFLIAIDISFVIIFGMGLLLSLALDKSIVVHDHMDTYAFPLIVGGFVITSLAFNDLGNKLKRIDYLMLPVSTLERLISAWLFTSVGWLVSFTVVFKLYTLLANPIGSLLFRGVQFEVFDPFSDQSLMLMKSYMIVQGIFLVGAAHFRGYVFAKVMFVIILLALLSAGIAYTILQDLTLQDDDFCLTMGEQLVGMSSHQFFTVAVNLFWWVLAPICYVLTYLGLKDQHA